MSHQHTETQRCLYCGNNPVQHKIVYLSQTSQLLMDPLSRIGGVVDHPLIFQALHAGVRRFVAALEWLDLISFSSDVSKAATERSQVIWEEAERRGIPMEQMVILGKHIEQYRAKIRGSWYYFNSLPIPMHVDRTMYAWMDNKLKLKRFFMKHGVKVPRGGRATNAARAEVLFNEVEKPVIVKPEIGSRGRHTMTHLYTREDLLHGFSIAQQLCHFVVVEEHLKGSVYRATYVGGKIVGILRGDPPRVTGDGSSSIAELIEKKNREKPEGVHDFRTTSLTHEFLGRQGYTLDSILPEGHTIDLHEKIGLSYGGDAIEEIEITHKELLAQLQRAGDLLGAPIVGFDFISEDITAHPDETRWGIIEANSMPFINLHHFPRTGTPINVAKHVWDLWGV